MRQFNIGACIMKTLHVAVDVSAAMDSLVSWCALAGGLTIRTGQFAFRITASTTLPINSLEMPDRPWEPITIKSTCSC
jgi:hypothetical protein